MGFSMVEKKYSPRDENTKTMAILIKLLTTKMVANKRLGFSKSLMIAAVVGSLLFSEDSSDSKSLGFKEKKATSAPDIKADIINKAMTKTI